MVLLAAAVCNKLGKAIVSRQFVEMTRSRIEGLLAAFPKLMSSGKQHTFVETESVRYVYQPLEKLYMLLITTKASNILEDLETLRLFARVIPEYCRQMDEAEIVDQAFPLIFAFDEIVALGYRENVNLAQIRTFTEMDSHEEKVFQAVRQTQEREARENMKRKAKELHQARKAAEKKGIQAPTFGGFGSSSSGRTETTVIESTNSDIPKQAYTGPSRPSGSGKGMKLGGKKNVEQFVDQLKIEGEAVTTRLSSKHTVPSKVNITSVREEGVNLRLEEKMTCTAGRDGGLQNLELFGMLTLHITREEYGKVNVSIANNDDKGIQLQTHPNVDKKLFQTSSCIGLKNPAKPFPLNQDIGVLKWRFQTTDETFMPLSINCWPSETGDGCDVNIEYELTRDDMELQDVVLSIPVPSGVGAPIVTECDGDYRHDTKKNTLDWSLPLIDASNKSGSAEFSVRGHPDDFFPVNVSFVSKKPYCNIQVCEVQTLDENHVKYSSEVMLFTEKYLIV